ncbi:hypothetical protein T11_2388 [Trichinella zimbabwensis]|uniref:Uncharacterized protein n=1 Tax=Trichinella zimbabwensis TaxID=268475 RepID=A0A0V1HVN1_9BILA|nr:hypothetical protein T11_2388 [Trichinella zimbabwensis]
MATKRERSHKGTSSCDDQPDNCELKSNTTRESKQFYSFRDSQLALLSCALWFTKFDNNVQLSTCTFYVVRYQLLIEHSSNSNNLVI